MKTREELQREWSLKGEKYAKDINEMVAFGTEHGWDNWEGEEAVDTRGKIGEAVIKLLREANENGTVEAFREEFAPAHSPLADMLDDKGGSIRDLCYIGEDEVIFMLGTSYLDRQACIVKDTVVTKLDEKITCFGKAMLGDIIAIAYADRIVICQGWEGEIITTFILSDLVDINVVSLIPFNDGSNVLFISNDGIFLVNETKEQLLHPIEEEEEDEDGNEYVRSIAMANATLSYDNKYIVVGDQCNDHTVLNSDGEKIGVIGAQSSYPHYCLFSRDDKQLLSNTCHFYNGASIGVETAKLNGINIPAWEEHEDAITLDEGMRVYAGVALEDYYILGDAYGYIRAIRTEGGELWQHFLGSTISGMTLSEDEKTLYVGTHAGILHKLTLNKKVRDTHTIGNADIYEDFRLLVWKNEDRVLVW